MLTSTEGDLKADSSVLIVFAMVIVDKICNRKLSCLIIHFDQLPLASDLGYSGSGVWVLVLLRTWMTAVVTEMISPVALCQDRTCPICSQDLGGSRWQEIG